METSEAEETSDTPLFWTEFFSDAGIVGSDIENYAVTFVKHRIRKNMLLELNKEYLSEMGITAMGDIIAIIRHAKAVLSKPPQTAAPFARPSSTGSKHETPLERPEKSLDHGRLSSPSGRSKATGRRSTPASRMVDHYLANEPGARLMSDDAPEPCQDLTRQLQFECANRKNSVFDRLGCNGSHNQNPSTHGCLGLSDKFIGFQVTLGRTSQASSSSKAADLRDVLKRPATSTRRDSGDSDSDDSECQYAGVLKKCHVPRKKRKTSPINNTQGSTACSPPSAGIFGNSAKQKPVSAKRRLGNKVFSV